MCTIRHAKNIKLTFRMGQCSKMAEAPSTFRGSFSWPLLAPPSNLFLESKAGDTQRSSPLALLRRQRIRRRLLLPGPPQALLGLNAFYFFLLVVVLFGRNVGIE